MTPFLDDVKLLDVTHDQQTAAKLIRLSRAIAAKQIDGAWWKLPVSKAMREQEADHHWVWRKIIGEYQRHGAWEALAVVGPEGDAEGAMLYRIDARSLIEPHAGAIYIDRLATAPRNRPWLVNPVRYRGAGTALLLAAVQHSYALGLRGRVWLSSLPSERTRRFYSRLGFEMISE